MLAFNKYEAVRFGDFKAELTGIDNEVRLKVQALDLTTESGIEEAREVLSKCFGDKSQQVYDFMKANMFPNDLQELQMYIYQGPQGVAKVSSAIDRAIDRSLDRRVGNGE